MSQRRSLLSMDDLDRDDIVRILATAGRFSITVNPNGGFTYRFIEEPIEAEPAGADRLT